MIKKTAYLPRFFLDDGAMDNNISFVENVHYCQGVNMFLIHSKLEPNNSASLGKVTLALSRCHPMFVQ